MLKWFHLWRLTVKTLWVRTLLSIKEAFKAYKLQLKDNPPDQLLPGLEDYTREQLFFLPTLSSMAQVWCTLENAAGFAQDVRGDIHFPARYRVFGCAMNSDDFAEAFKCPVGSPINPEKKCVLWWLLSICTNTLQVLSISN